MSLEERFPAHLSAELQSYYQVILSRSIDEFVDHMSVLFAYSVLTEKNTSTVFDEPLVLSDYPTLISLMDRRHRIKVDPRDWSSFAEESLMPLSALASMTWVDYFTNAIEQYVTHKFDAMLLEPSDKGSRYLWSFLTSEEQQDFPFQQQIIDHLVGVIGGEPYFKEKVDYLMTVIYDQDPVKFYAQGHERALALRLEVEQAFLQDFAWVPSAPGKLEAEELWGRVKRIHLALQGASIPDEQLTLDFYDSSLKSVLRSLRFEGVSETEVRALTSLGPELFSPEVMSALYDFVF